MALDRDIKDATRASDSTLAPTMSTDVHLAALDDLHDGMKDLVPRFDHPIKGVQESYESASRDLTNFSIVGAGVRGQMNGNLINQFFNPTDGVSNDTAQRVDGNLEAFLNGERAIFAENVNTRLNNNGYDPKKQTGNA